jgi:hypothetical protein
MTSKDKAIAELKAIDNSGDTEINHSRADDVLCELLNDLGFDDVVDLYKMIDKWYA